MENEIISEGAQPEEVVKKIANLALSQGDSAISDLRGLVRFGFQFYGDHTLAVSLSIFSNARGNRLLVDLVIMGLSLTN